MSMLSILVDANPDKKWDWYELSKHVDWSLINKYPDKDWNFYYLCKRDDIDWNVVKHHISKHWQWWILCEKNDLSWDLIKEYPDFTYETYIIEVDETDAREWPWKELSKRIDFPWKILQDPRLCNKNWDWRFLSRRVPLDFLQNNINLPWAWDSDLNLNPNLDEKFMKQYIDKLNCPLLSKNPKLSFSVVLNHLDKPWSWEDLSKLESLSLNVVIKYPNLPWHGIDITKHKKLNWIHVYCNPNLPWDFEYLSKRQLGSMSDLDKIIKLQRWWKSIYYRPGRPYSQRIIKNIYDKIKQ